MTICVASVLAMFSVIKRYVASNQQSVNLKMPSRLLLESLSTDCGTGSSARRIAQSLVLVFPDMSMELTVRCKAALACGASPRIPSVDSVENYLSLSLVIDSRIVGWILSSSLLTAAAAGGC